MNKNEIFDKAKNGVAEIPVSTIIGEYMSLKKNGIHMVGICPFHNANTDSSFRATDSKHRYKCFACGAGGNGVDFVSRFKGISYRDALFDVALEYGIISSSEYELCMKKNSAPPVKIKTFQKQELKAVSNKPVDALMKHNVYTFMHDFFGLTEKHRKHLKEVRRLSDEAIDKDFFSITANKKTAFVKALRIKFPEYSTEMLMEIPGFYYDQTYSCLRMSSYEGIGICIRGFDSHIKAIQIRQDVVKPGRSRYVWFASTFAWQKPLLYKGGNGTGAPIDCLYPTRLKRKYAIGIVEGKFKAEILADQGLFALSVQGVGNWKGGDGWTGIDYEIDQLNYFSALGMDTIYIFYDADMLSNNGVFHHAMALGEFLENKYPNMHVVYALWHEGYGKGIDDLYINGHSNDVIYTNRICLYNVQKELDLSVREALNIADCPQNKIPKDIKARYQVIMQGLMESALLPTKCL